MGLLYDKKDSKLFVSQDITEQFPVTQKSTVQIPPYTMLFYTYSSNG